MAKKQLLALLVALVAITFWQAGDGDGESEDGAGRPQKPYGKPMGNLITHLATHLGIMMGNSWKISKSVGCKSLEILSMK